MRRIEIRRPRTTDRESLHAFFRTVVTDAFAREGIAHLLDDIEQEIASKIAFLRQDEESGGEVRHFLMIQNV